MKKIVCTILILALALTAFGCDTAGTSSEQLLSDEEAYKTVGELSKKAEDFTSFMIEVFEFGPYNIDALDTFDNYGYTYAEFHLQNLLDYKNSEIFNNRFSKDVFDFSSKQEIFDYIETFALSAADTLYSVNTAFEEKNGKLYYIAHEISPSGMTVVENVKILNKTEDEIFFSGTRTDNYRTPADFSMIRVSKGEWRLSRDFFRDRSDEFDSAPSKDLFEKIAAAFLCVSPSEFEIGEKASAKDVFNCFQAYLSTESMKAELEDACLSSEYLRADKVEAFAESHFGLGSDEMQKTDEYDKELNAYRRTAFGGDIGTFKILDVTGHAFYDFYSFEYTDKNGTLTGEISANLGLFPRFYCLKFS